jgi:hypothetical protein
MLSSVMMLSLMNLETSIEKQWFQGWILDYNKSL